jgi:hypothetical protein
LFRANSNSQIYCTQCKPEVRREKNKVWQHDYYLKNQIPKLEKSRAYNKSEKGRAAQQLRDAVRQGKVTRRPCEICQEPNAQGHHEDYSKPLEVRWLCPKHHREEHLFEPWQNELRRAGYTGGFLLGQLIEECGDGFSALMKISPIDWKAGRPTGDNIRDYNSPIGVGLTPIEAVARLWLALNRTEAVKS